MNKDLEEVSIDTIRSAEVQEIISQVPSGIVRWGMTVLFTATLTLLTISWFIKYPDVLLAKVIITTSTPPITLVSRATGNLVLLKRDNQEVRQGEMIAYLRANASPQTVLDLEKNIRDPDGNFVFLASQSALGELEQDYATLLRASLELTLFQEAALYDVQIKQLQKQRVAYRKLHNTLNYQRNLALQELALASEKFNIDSILFAQNINAVVDFNRDKSVWLQQQKTFSNVETALINSEIQLNQVSKQISDLEIQKTSTRQELETAVTTSRKGLLAHIAKWKESYLFTAPEEGKVAYIGFKENEMFIDGGQPVFSILPSSDTLIARAELPLFNSGKVKAGHRVNLKLENYPFEQYGTVSGVVASISVIPNEERYYINIVLPNNLTTNQNQILEFRQQLSGTAEIITEELRLLERFLYQFRSVLHAW